MASYVSIGTAKKANFKYSLRFIYAALTCRDIDLPTVNAGSFDCVDYFVGDKCNLMCDDGYHPYPKETVCEAYDGNKANWTVWNFHCTGEIHFLQFTI